MYLVTYKAPNNIHTMLMHSDEELINYYQAMPNQHITSYKVNLEHTDIIQVKVKTFDNQPFIVAVAK